VKSLLRITDYIKNIKVLDDKFDNPYIAGFGQAAWTLISSIYKGGWDKLKMENQNLTIVVFQTFLTRNWKKRIKSPN